EGYMAERAGGGVMWRRSDDPASAAPARGSAHPRSNQALPNAGDAQDFPLFSFGGRRAKTANEDHLALARSLEREGKDEWAIWHNTGWARGVDGKWRFEIPDDGADFGVAWNTLRRRKSETSLDEAFDHPALFEAYPILRDVKVRASEVE